MSATRLLVLGVIRFMQPVHGYDVRRELLSWRIEENTNVKPGSIYGAIRTLEKDGCIAVHERAGGDGRPEKTSYVLTGEGEKEYQVMLRAAWWTVSRPSEPLVPALSLMWGLPREELIRALSARMAKLEADIDELAFRRDAIHPDATTADDSIPGHVREIADFIAARSRAELEWARGFQRRLRDGAYRFTGDPRVPDLGPGRGWPRA
ncbi:MAG: PadR family transcriptional regulator [Solirubrobacteraceae bacterium]